LNPVTSATIVNLGSAEHQVYLGDSLAWLPEVVADASVDLIFADPPYNLGKQFGAFHDSWPDEAAYVSWCQSWLEICLRKLAPHGSLYLMASTQCMPYLDLYLRQHLQILSRIVWTYDSSGVQAKNYFGSLYEPILFAVKNPKKYTFNAQAIQVEAKTGAQRKLIDYRKTPPQPYRSTKVPGNVWSFPRVRYRMSEYTEHPSQKPEALLTRIIQASSQPQDLILDPFAGSFTTAAVAQKLGRRSVSLEREQVYLEAGLRRLGFATPELKK